MNSNPDSENDIWTLLHLLGTEKTIEIIAEAEKLGKKIKISDGETLDSINYEFID